MALDEDRSRSLVARPPSRDQRLVIGRVVGFRQRHWSHSGITVDALYWRALISRG
jgi:hypothetical protein